MGTIGRKKLSLTDALYAVTLLCKHAEVRGDELILKKTALEPLEEVRDYLVSKYNQKIIEDNDISIKYKTPEPQGEEYEEE